MTILVVIFGIGKTGGRIEICHLVDEGRPEEDEISRQIPVASLSCVSHWFDFMGKVCSQYKINNLDGKLRSQIRSIVHLKSIIT
jgi:hypothetical protein